MKLYELADQYQDVLAKVEDGVPEDVLKDTLESIEGDIAEKIESMAKLIRSIEGEEAIYQAEEKRLYDKRKVLENHRASVKKYMEEQLSRAGFDKIKGQLFTVTFQDNPPSVQILGEIAERYYVPQPATLDRRAMIADLKNGIKVENAELIKTRSLRIR